MHPDCLKRKSPPPSLAGATVGTLGGNPICYVSTAVAAAEAAAAEAIKRTRAAIYGRMVLCPSEN